MHLIRFLSFLSFFSSFVGFSSGQAIAAWHNTYGAQVIIQNSTTGDVYYSNCNSQDQPAFPTAPLNVFPFTKKPKLGSAFAGIGYVGGDTIYAAIWYQDDRSTIWQVLAQCSKDDTTFTVTGTYDASVNITTPLSPSSGLAAVLLSGSSGYRVFHHNSSGNVFQLMYSGRTGWTDTTPISPDVPVGKSLSAAFYKSSNMTAVYPLSDRVIEVSEYNSDSTFHDSTFPYPLKETKTTSKITTPFTVDTTTDIGNNALPNFSAANATVGVAMDVIGAARRMFYIDSTGQFQYYSCDLAAKIGCSLEDTQSEPYWGPADDPSGALGVAWVDRTSDVFYFSKGTLINIRMVSGVWQKLTTLTDDVSTWSLNAKSSNTAVPTAASSGTSSGSTTSSTTSGSPNADVSSSSSPSSELTGGAKAGIAIGVIAIVGLAAASGGFFIWRRKHAASHHNNIDTDNKTPGSAVGAYTEVPGTSHGGKFEMEGLSTKSPMYSNVPTPLNSPPPQYMYPGPHEQVKSPAPSEMYGNVTMPQEVHGHSTMINEMDGHTTNRYELG